jgi:hypothetical protein
MIAAFPNKAFYMKSHIRHMKKNVKSTVDWDMNHNNCHFSKLYLAITIIMSKCKYIICGSGNCSIWIMLFRGHAKDVYQNRDGKWLKEGAVVSDPTVVALGD